MHYIEVLSGIPGPGSFIADIKINTLIFKDKEIYITDGCIRYQGVSISKYNIARWRWTTTDEWRED